MPSVKAPRRGPLRTPMTVKEPWGGGGGMTEGRAAPLLWASVYPLGKQDLRNPTAGLCASVSLKGRGRPVSISLPWLEAKCPFSPLTDAIPRSGLSSCPQATAPPPITSTKVAAGSVQPLVRWNPECMTLPNLSARREMPHLWETEHSWGGGSPGGLRPRPVRTELQWPDRPSHS